MYIVAYYCMNEYLYCWYIVYLATLFSFASRCSVFLIDRETDELIAKVFDGITYDDSEVVI